MNTLAALLLGVVQGLSEFLPVSSSAHLILARAFFGWDGEAFGLAFDVACHVGTLLAVIVFFRRDIVAMAMALPRIAGPSPPARQARLIAIGTIPVIVVGAFFADAIESRVRTPAIAAAALAIGGIGLLVAERLGTLRREEPSLGAWEALALGAAQATALVPGVSRSGATMTVGMLLGLRREAAARFSFLLGVPAIAAAGAKAGLELAQTGVNAETLGLFAVGLVSSAVVGYVTIKYFLRFLVTHRLDVFAYYRLALAGTTVIWWMGR